MKSFQGKVVAITGAASGMGRALAIAAAQRGAEVALCDVDMDGLERSAEIAGGFGRPLSTHAVDVADREAVVRFADDVVARHGRVHAVFNNAGVSVTDMAELMTFDDLEWLMGINFWGVVHGTRAFLPHLRRVDDAHIVNTSSVFGLIGVPTQSAYNAAKFAVRGYTEALQQELAGSGVGVTSVLPGGVKTNIVNRSRYVMRENDAPTKEEMSAQFEQMARLSPADAARKICDGVEKGKKRVLVGTDAMMLDWLVRLLPVGYQRLLAARGPRGRK